MMLNMLRIGILLAAVFGFLEGPSVTQAQFTYAREKTKGDVCPNPEEQCLVIYSCRSIITRLKAHTISHRDLKKITCGFEASTPKVCCPPINHVDQNIQVNQQGSGNRRTPVKPSQTTPIERTTPSLEQMPVLLSGSNTPMKAGKPNIIKRINSTVGEKEVLISEEKESTTTEENVISNSKPPFTSEKPDTDNEEILPTECGISYAILKVFGGKEAEPGAWPWLAALQFKDGEKLQFACGGVLIHKRYVLTASHCVEGQRGLRNLVGIRLGDHNLATEDDEAEPQHLLPEEIIPHKNYTLGPQHNNDIALIKLDKDVTISSFVTPICVPSESPPLIESSLLNKSLTVAGWGSDGNNSGTDTLQQVDIGLVSLSECAPMYRRFGLKLKHTQLCAGGKGKDSCRGDSGGPLMHASSNGRYEVAGVVSLGSVKCGQSLPGVYTVVWEFRQWIIDSIKARL